MDSPQSVRVRAGLKLAAVVFVALAGVAVLYAVNPVSQPVFLRCVIHEYTGLACPGCGGLRAVHQFSHGDFSGALIQNPFIFLLLPVLGWLVVRELSPELIGRKLPPKIIRPSWVMIGFALMILFTVARNLPIQSLRWLGPQ